MSSSGTDEGRRAEAAAEPTANLPTCNTATNVTARPPETAGAPDPLLLLLRPPQADGELGRLANFAVTRLLGRGGMGAVFAADDLLVRRKVALKVMRPELTARLEARAQFLREAQTAGGLEHDHVIPVYQVAEDNGVWFIAMPLLKGEALDERLKREGRLPIPAVLKLGRETAEGLAAAHAQGLVHRDIKPGNLWLEGTDASDGAGFRRIKILDFGLARAVQDDQHLTGEGGMVGTPAYMAPEQAGGEEVDHRTDLFSLGAVLYRCCAGELPFHGPNTMAVLSALANKTPIPVGEKNPAVPAALADLIMRLLAKAPGDRPQSAEEVAESLRRIEQGHATVTAPAAPGPTPRRRRRVSALTLFVAALVGLGLAAVAAVIVVKVRTPDGKETAVTAPTVLSFETGWDKPVDPDGDCKLVADKGSLTIVVPGKHHNLGVEKGMMNAPRLLREVSGDFTAQVRVGGDFQPGAVSTTPEYLPFLGAGLVLMAGDQTYLRLERAVVNRGGPLDAYVNWELRRAGRALPAFGNAALSEPDQPTYLRLRRQGDRFLASFSQDGQNWDGLQALDLKVPSAVKVGVAAVSTSAEPFKANYYDFRLTESGK